MRQLILVKRANGGVSRILRHLAYFGLQVLGMREVAACQHDTRRAARGQLHGGSSASSPVSSRRAATKSRTSPKFARSHVRKLVTIVGCFAPLFLRETATMKCPACWAEKAFRRPIRTFADRLLQCLTIVPMRCHHCYHRFRVSRLLTLGQCADPPPKHPRWKSLDESRVQSPDDSQRHAASTRRSAGKRRSSRA